MLLFIIRHGKAERDAPDHTDASRALTHRGERQAQWLARAVLERSRGKVVLLSSPIRRARQTAVPIGAALGTAPIIDDRLTTDSTVRACIEAIDDAAVERSPETLILVGHNPHFEALAAALLRDTSAGFRSMRTGEACLMDIDTLVRRNSGELLEWLRFDDDE